MLYKKILLFMGLLSILSTISIAQKGSEPKIYLKIFGGYGFLTPGSFRLTSTSSGNFTVGNTGLGEGLHFGGGIGYIVNDFLNLGIDAEYLKGNDLKSSSTYFGGLGSGMQNSRIPYSVLSIIPNITFKALSKPNYLIYTRIGIMVTASTKSSSIVYDSSNLITNSPHPIIVRNINSTFSYNVNIGVQAALGVQIRLTDNLRAFVELIGNYLPITPSAATTTTKTSYYDNGPVFVSTSSATSSVTYKKTGNSSSDELPSSAYNVNYIGLNIALAFRL